MSYLNFTLMDYFPMREIYYDCHYNIYGLHCFQEGKKETTLVTPNGPKSQMGYFEILGRRHEFVSVPIKYQHHFA